MKSIMMSAISRAVGTIYPSETHDFSGVRVTKSLVFCVVFCRSLFVPLDIFFLLNFFGIILYVL